MNYGKTALILVLWFVCTVSQSCDVENALQTFQRILNLPGEEITPILSHYNSLNIEGFNQDEKRAYLFKNLQIQKWGVRISEFTSLANLLFSYLNLENQKTYQQSFTQALDEIERFRKSVNILVKTHHPGLKLRSKKLQQSYKGDGITIAVFDLFDNELLNAQRQHYPNTQIEELIHFGNPVSDNHGNIVIDIILTIAPNVKILPISAETAYYNESMKFVLASGAQILNMSRTFPEKDGMLDPLFSDLMLEILKKMIVTKSLGNTGTDLEGEQTPVRKENHLPPIGNPFSYDLKLINEFLAYKHQISFNSLLFTINLNLIGDNVSLTATIPGSNPLAINQSFAIRADGIYSWSSDNYESGSSFAAPQLAAISALLWQACLSHGKAEPYLITDLLKLSAIPSQNLIPSITGLGELNSDVALRLCNMS